ncbi:MAG: alpha amylase C-terminal domain-containing protein, partial [Acidobacteriota bacterium]
RFINPLSHDEVVHGKGSLLGKMPGDLWQKRANLRALLAYQFTRPGKQLLFMGSELAPSREWNYETSLDWHLLGDPDRAAMHRFVCDLGALYREHPCLWRSDPDWQGFQWIACSDHQHSVFCYERRLVSEEADAGTLAEAGSTADTGPPAEDDSDRLIVVLNLTPVPREDYRIGVPVPGAYRRLMSTDDVAYGGSGYDNAERIDSEATPADGCRDSLVLNLPPLAALVLAPDTA